MRYDVEVDGSVRQVDIRREAGLLVLTIDGRPYTLDAARVDARTVSLLIADGERSVSQEVVVDRGVAGSLRIHVGAAVVDVGANGARRRLQPDRRSAGPAGPERIVAPMPGRVMRLLVERGAHVAARQPVVVIEAMKMENELRAGAAGVVADIAVRPGQSVDAGALLMLITGEAAS
jgi:biotin carboxyl carrier protein